MAVCGPLCCSKTALIIQLLLRNTFYPKFKCIYYLCQNEQPKSSSLERKLNIIFTEFSGFKFISQLVFDISSEEQWQDFSKLATAGRHKNISVIYVKNNLFQHGKRSKNSSQQNPHHVQIT